MEEVGDFFKVVLRLQEQPGNVPVNVPINGPVNVPVNERQKWFLEQLERGINCKAADLAAHWRITEKTAKRDIADLKKKHLVIFAGAPKTGLYRILKEK